MKRIATASAAAFIAFTTAATPGRGDDLVGWRGDGTGVFETDARIVEWSRKSNALWTAKLPNWSNGMPVPTGDRVIVPSEEDRLLAVKMDDGTVLWNRGNGYDTLMNEKEVEAVKRCRKLIGAFHKWSDRIRKQPFDTNAVARLESLCGEMRAWDGYAAAAELSVRYSKPKINRGTGYSSATPLTDGRHVWMIYGTGVAACFDVEGNLKWRRMHQHPRVADGLSASPVMAGGVLVLTVNDVLGVDPATGDEKWRAKTKPRHGTPAVVKCGNRLFVATANGELIEASDGTVAARKLGALTYGSPLAIGDTIYYVNGQHAWARRVSVDAEGKVHVEQKWKTKVPKDRYYASPLVYKDRVYVITQKGVLSVLKTDDGAVVYTKKVNPGGTVYASPCCAAGPDLVYLTGESGRTVAIEAGDTFKVVGKNGLDKSKSSLFIAGDRLLARGGNRLFCIRATP